MLPKIDSALVCDLASIDAIVQDLVQGAAGVFIKGKPNMRRLTEALEVTHLPISSFKPNPENPRIRNDKQRLQSTACGDDDCISGSATYRTSPTNLYPRLATV